jgi:hypothetical protein
MFKHLTSFCTGTYVSFSVFQTSGVDAGVDFGRLVASCERFFFVGMGVGYYHPVVLVNRHMFYCQSEHNTLNTMH